MARVKSSEGPVFVNALKFRLNNVCETIISSNFCSIKLPFDAEVDETFLSVI